MTRASSWLLAAGLVLAASWALAAEEVRPLEFIHALQERGYHDAAVDYLKMLKALPETPKEVADVWDLEMSKSLRGAANLAGGYVKEAEALSAEAQKHLDKFLKEKPNHPEAVSAMASFGNLSIDRALALLRSAKAAADKAQKTKLLAEARAAIEEARPRFQQAAQRYHAVLDSLPTVSSATGKPRAKLDPAVQQARAQRDKLDLALVNAEFQLALIDYYVAQTYEDPRSPERRAALQRAAKAFDDIFQTHRVDAQNRVSVIGLTAHMWHGKCVDESGDDELAYAIYEEVLANEPEPRTPEDKVLDPLFAQVRQFFFVLHARKYPDQYMTDALQWLEQSAKKSRRYEGYQAVAVDVAKRLLASADQAAGTQKTRLTNDAMILLADVARFPGPYQQEAFGLRRKYGKTAAGDPSEAKTFEEALALAQAAAEGGQWQVAAAAFARALDMAASVKDKGRVAEVRNSLAHARMMVANDQLGDNKLEECLKTAGAVVGEFKDTPAAAVAASLASKAALGLYSRVPAEDAAGKAQALARLQKIVEVTESTWPGKPEADDVRLDLGKVSLLERKFDEALGVFDKVNPKSERYPVALYLSAYTHWQRYRDLLAKGGEQARDQAAADRAKAAQLAVTSLAALRKQSDSASGDPGAGGQGKGPGRQHVDPYLLLADMALDAKQPKEAANYVEPLLPLAKSARSAGDANTAFRIYFAATRVYLSTGDTARARETGMALAEVGADAPPVNFVLVEFAKALDTERKSADAALTNTAAGNAAAIAAAKAQLAAIQGSLAPLLKKLAARKQHSLSSLMATADLCAASGLTGEAGELYRQVLATPNVDARAATRTRAQLVGLLRREVALCQANKEEDKAKEKFAEAYKEAKQLIQDNPRALEPQMELGRILQTRAEREPRHYEEAVGQWLQVTNWLRPMAKRPPEYYEAVYNAAFCLNGQARNSATPSPEKLKQAAGLLKSTLILNEKLSGPDMVAKYQALLAKLQPQEKPQLPPKKR